MIHADRCIDVDPKQIRPHGQWLFWSRPPGDALRLSLASLGQLCPLLLVEEKKGFSLIAGYSRYSALKEAGTGMMAVVLPEMDLVQRGLVYMHSNLARPKSGAQMVKALRFFVPLMTQDTLQSEVYPSLGLRPGSSLEKQCLEWMNLSKKWDDLLEEEMVPLSLSGLLTRLNAAERQAVVPFLTRWKWSRNNAEKWLTWLWEKSRMESVSLQELVQRANMSEVLESDLSPKDGIHRLVRLAHDLRYPVLTGMENVFSNLRNRVGRGTMWNVRREDEFESDTVVVQAKIRKKQDLSRAAREFDHIAAARVWERWWSIHDSTE